MLEKIVFLLQRIGDIIVRSSHRVLRFARDKTLGNILVIISMYIVLFLFVVEISNVLFIHFGWACTNVDSAYYLLSALVQSQSAIVVIVITLSVVATQLSAQTYTPRVFSMFMRNPSLWVLLLSYGGSIFYDATILSTVTENNIDYYSFYIKLAIYFMFFTIIALVPYILLTTRALRPENILNKLDRALDRDRYTEEVTGLRNPKEIPSYDKILPMYDMIKNAITMGDLPTALSGTRLMDNIRWDIIGSSKYDENKKIALMTHLNEFFKKIVEKAFLSGDDLVGENALNLIKVGLEVSTSKKWVMAVKSTNDCFRNLAINAARKEMLTLTESMIKLICEVGTTRTLKKENTIELIEILCEIKKYCKIHKWDALINKVLSDHEIELKEERDELSLKAFQLLIRQHKKKI